MLEWLFGISSLIDFNHECDCGFAVVRVWLTHILARITIQQFEIGIPTTFHHAAPELRFAVWIFEINDEMATRGFGASCCVPLPNPRPCKRSNDCPRDRPRWSTVRRAIAHDGREVGKLRPSTRPISRLYREIAMFSPIKDRAFHEPTFFSGQCDVIRKEKSVREIAILYR